MHNLLYKLLINMKNITKADIKRAATFLRRIHTLQSDIYYFTDHLKDKGHEQASQNASNSGFEMDVSTSEMESCLKSLQDLYK